ncbi:uncharacterized protein FIBRA_00272 [Fibroporia radiculosa]|uniref:DUF6534 domain-containing protein n=1 Tax=Fibroporia radiculosa TaxID=599839 RepID=J7SCN8_9APHY|nr:uncharacterized protein FIBRA_00272 [Fibroporia radiculosa]CCL98278.1 predicted protein [Fibroporia radiculosa]
MPPSLDLLYVVGVTKKLCSNPQSLLDSIGPQILGTFFNWALLGVLNIQVYLYTVSFPRDRLFFKCLVYSLLIYEWVETALVTTSFFNVYLYNFGNPEAVIGFQYTWFAVPVMGAVVSAIVQIFFAWRIYILSRLRWLAGTIILLSLIQLGAGLAGGAKLEQLPAWEATKLAEPELITWLVTSGVVDLVIAVSMTILLLYSKTGVKSTDAVIDRIVRLGIETGTLTATMAIICAIVANVPPVNQTLVFECIALVLVKLYANTLLTNLNSRTLSKKVRSAEESFATNRIELPVRGDTSVAEFDGLSTGRTLDGASPFGPKPSMEGTTCSDHSPRPQVAVIHIQQEAAREKMSTDAGLAV